MLPGRRERLTQIDFSELYRRGSMSSPQLPNELPISLPDDQFIDPLMEEWRQLAEAISRGTDSERITQLAKKLGEAPEYLLGFTARNVFCTTDSLQR
jgi:hypothetical protein